MQKSSSVHAIAWRSVCAWVYLSSAVIKHQLHARHNDLQATLLAKYGKDIFHLNLCLGEGGLSPEGKGMGREQGCVVVRVLECAGSRVCEMGVASLQKGP